MFRGDIACGSQLLTIDPNAYAAIIGKAGANLKKMEKELGVKFDLLKWKSELRIRGVPEKVVAAKIAILNFVNDIRTTINLPIPSTYARTKAELDKLVAAAVSMFLVEISVPSPSDLVIKGTLKLAEEAKLYLTEIFENRANFSLQLQPHHFVEIEVRAASTVKPLEKAHNVVVTLDAASLRLGIAGTPDDVSQAKRGLMRVLTGVFPSEFVSVVMSAACMKEVGSHKNLMEINAASGATLEIDRPLACIRIGGSAEAVAVAVRAVQAKVASWQQCHGTIDIEEYMLPMLVGKNGSNIMNLEKSTGASIKVIRTSLVLEIEAPTAAVAQAALASIGDKVHKLKSEHFEMVVDTDLMGTLIGKQGATINKFRSDTSANIDIDMQSRMLKVRFRSCQ
jgi:transcription antitermination factor NusA-like protein